MPVADRRTDYSVDTNGKVLYLQGMNEGKPRITTLTSRPDWAMEFIATGFLLLTVVLTSVFFNDLPDRIPRHFDATGKADGFGNKGMILILPFINLIVFGLLTWAQRVPHLHNFPVNITTENAARQYQNSIRLLRTIKTLIAIQFFYITFATIETALGKMNGLSPFFVPVTLGTLLVAIVFFLTRSYRLR